ncbi:hypothetical protein B551_0223040 [Cupriavidus sp. HPC(L)]|nr:hypothetical protein B551_0223040 [Cupriavidus sp. HPC(L)]
MSARMRLPTVLERLEYRAQYRTVIARFERDPRVVGTKGQ